MPVRLTRYISTIATLNVASGDDGAADELRLQQREAAVIEEAGEWGGVIRTGWTGRSDTWPQANRPSDKRSPDAADAVNRNRADGIVDAQPLEQLHAQADNDAGDAAKKDGARRADPVARAGNRDQSGEEPVDRKADIPFLAEEVGIDHCGEPGGASRQRRVGRDAADAGEIHRRERGAGVEAVPAEPQDQAAGCGDGEIVRQHRAAAVALELAAEPWAENDGAGQGDEAADGVNDRGSGEIVEARCRGWAESIRSSPWWRGTRPVPRPSGQ